MHGSPAMAKAGIPHSFLLPPVEEYMHTVVSSVLSQSHGALFPVKREQFKE